MNKMKSKKKKKEKNINGDMEDGEGRKYKREQKLCAQCQIC